MNERKLIDEIKLAVQQEAIAGYWNGRVFVSDDKKTYTNIISNSQPIGVGFIVPYDGRWLLVVGSNNSEGRKNIINSKRKRLVSVEENFPVKTIFAIYNNATDVIIFYLGGDRASKKLLTLTDYNYTLDSTNTRAFLINKGNGSIIQIETYEGFYYNIKLNNKPLVLIDTNFYPTWKQKQNLGNYLEALDDLRRSAFGKRIIKDDQLISLNIVLNKLNQPDFTYPGYEKSFGFFFFDTDGTIETLRKNGNVSVCSLTTEETIEWEEFDLGLVINYSPSFTFFELPNPVTVTSHTITQNITASGNIITFSFNKTPTSGYYDSQNWNADVTVNVDGESITRIVNGNPVTTIEGGLNRGHNFGIFPSPPVNEPGSFWQIRGPFYVRITNFVGVSGGEPWGSVESRELDQELGYYKRRVGYLSKKNFVDGIEASTGSTWTSGNKTTYTLPAYTTGVSPYVSSTVARPSFYHSLTTVKYAKNEHTKVNIQGTAVVTNTLDGEIIQEYKGSIHNWANKDYRFDSYYQVKYYYTRPKLLALLEETNIIKLVIGENEIVLNTNDFGVINCDTEGNEKISISQITLDSTAFTISIVEILKYTKNLNIQNVVGVEPPDMRGFNPASFTGNFLMGYEIDNKEVLIRGVIESSPNYSDSSGNLTIECKIISIAQQPTSFKNFLIMDTGSFYNYWFRKHIPLKYLPYNTINNLRPWFAYDFGNIEEVVFDLIINKTILPTIPLNSTFFSLYFSSNLTEYHTYNYLQELSKIATTNNQNDTIKGNKIYSVVKVENNKAWIEQWDILENGDVKYKKVFQVDYVPLKKPKTDEGEELTIFAHSYYPS